jgi:hypothetical protein
MFSGPSLKGVHGTKASKDKKILGVVCEMNKYSWKKDYEKRKKDNHYNIGSGLKIQQTEKVCSSLLLLFYELKSAADLALKS